MQSLRGGVVEKAAEIKINQFRKCKASHYVE
jgi:hypothetical protein